MFAYSLALVERVKTKLALVKADRKGVTALEYGLLAGLIAVVVIAGATLIGTNLNTMFNGIAGKLVLPA
jgi:pilus assembly protein Flp/PilA